MAEPVKNVPQQQQKPQLAQPQQQPKTDFMSRETVKQDEPLDIQGLLNELAEMKAKLAKLEAVQATMPVQKVVEAPADPPPVVKLHTQIIPEGAKIRTVRAKLPHCRVLDVEVMSIPGVSDLAILRQAEEAYFKYFGILKSEHRLETQYIDQE